MRCIHSADGPEDWAVVGVAGLGALLQGERLEVVGAAGGGGEPEQVVDGRGVAGRRPLIDLGDGGAEAGAREQPGDAPAESQVFIALPPLLAAAVKDRLESQGLKLRFEIPGSLPSP